MNLGPLISAQRRDRVEVLVQSAIDEDAGVVCGAKRPDGFVKGFYYEPTVLVGTNEMRIAPKEIFGPVMTVIPYSGEDRDAVRKPTIRSTGSAVVSSPRRHHGHSMSPVRCALGT